MKVIVKKNLDKLVSILESITNITAESIMSFDKDGVKLRIVDLSSVMLLCIDINKDFFDEYVIEKDVSFNIDFSIMLKIVKSMKKGFTIVDKDNEIEFSSLTNMLVRSIKKYVAVKDERINPKLEYDFQCDLDFPEFIDDVDTLLEASTILQFIVTKGKMEMKSFSNVESINIKKDVKNSNVEKSAYFSLEYLDKLNKLSNVFSTISLSIQTNTPLKFEGNADNIKFVGWLANRIED